MTATVIDGKEFAGRVRAQVASHVARLKADHGLTPGLAVVLVGEDPASQVYVRNKAKQTVEVGMRSFEHRLDTSATEAELLALVAVLSSLNGHGGGSGQPWWQSVGIGAAAVLVFLVAAIALRIGVVIEPFALTVMVLVAALPSASNVSLLAERFGADNGRIARIILVTTAAAFLTFSGAVALLQP